MNRNVTGNVYLQFFNERYRLFSSAITGIHSCASSVVARVGGLETGAA